MNGFAKKNDSSDKKRCLIDLILNDCLILSAIFLGILTVLERSNGLKAQEISSKVTTEKDSSPIDDPSLGTISKDSTSQVSQSTQVSQENQSPQTDQSSQTNQASQTNQSLPDLINETTNDQALEQLSNDPSFQEFSDVFDQMTQLPNAPLLQEKKASSENLDSTIDSILESSSNPLFKDSAIGSFPTNKILFSDKFNDLPDELKEKVALLKERETQLIALWLDALINASQIGYRAKLLWENKENCFDMSDGKMIDSADFWHLSLHGPFFFQVRNIESNETFYTKAGDFEISSQGFLQLNRKTNIFELTPKIQIPDSIEIELDQNGNIYSSSQEAQPSKEQIGKIELFYFRNPMRLFSNDGVFFQTTEQSGTPQKIDLSSDSPFGIFPSSLELSNAPLDDIFGEIQKIQSLLNFLRQ